MSNKAIDKEYLKQQFVNFDKCILMNKYEPAWTTVPTDSFTPSQYNMWNGKTITWQGDFCAYTIQTGCINVNLYPGQHYQVYMVGNDEETPTSYAFSHINPINIEQLDDVNTAYVLNNASSDYASNFYNEQFIFQYTGTDNEYSTCTSSGNSASRCLKNGRSYLASYSCDYGWDFTELASQAPVTYSISETTAEGSALKTYQLYQSVDGGTPTEVSGSVINIPKDFLVRDADVVTATTNGGFWWKGVFYEKASDYTATGTEIKYVSTDGTSTALYTDGIDANDMTSVSWPVTLYSDAALQTTVGQIPLADASAFVKAMPSGTVSANNLSNGKKYIDFVINSKDSTTPGTNATHLYLALDDLVSSYTAGAGLSIDSENKISLNLFYTSLPAYVAGTTSPVIQYIGTDDVDTTANGYSGAAASPTTLQKGGWYQWDATYNSNAGAWILINTAKEDTPITFSLSDFS